MLSNLPPPWHIPSNEAHQYLFAEFHKELPSMHILAGVEIELFAYNGLDDLLFKHIQENDRYTVAHLSWSGRKEIKNHPSVEFTGSLSEFLEWNTAHG